MWRLLLDQSKGMALGGQMLCCGVASFWGSRAAQRRPKCSGSPPQPPTQQPSGSEGTPRPEGPLGVPLGGP